MTKKKKTDEQPQNEQIVALLNDGTATLTADTPEALAAMIDEIPADTHYAAGAVGRKPDTGEYTLRIDIDK